MKISEYENSGRGEADYVGDDMATTRLLKRLMDSEIPVESFYKEKGNLESLFLELTSAKNEEENEDEG